MPDLVSLLESTPAARWHKQVHGHKRFASRLTYYRALCSCLSRLEPGAVFAGGDARERVVDKAGLKSASSLYKVLREGGVKSPSVMVIFEPPWQPEMQQPDIVDQLILETKIWDYWPHRRGWLNGLAGIDDRRFAATTMIDTLAAWAADHPRLALAGAGAAPELAVQDLGAIFDHRVPAESVRSLLDRVVELGVGPLGAALDAVDTVYDDLMGLYFETGSYVRRVLEEAMEQLDAIASLLPRLTDSAKADVAARLEPRFAQIRHQTIGKGDG